MFTSPGFVFLLLPLCVVLYYATPNHYKVYALTAISIFFYFQMEQHSVALIGVVAIDALCVWWTKHRENDRISKSLILACIGKNVSVLLLFGIILPVTELNPAPTGVFAFMLASIFSLTLYLRDEFPALDAKSFLATSLLFMRLPAGPLDDPRKLTEDLNQPLPSLSMLGQGIMQLVFGIAKQAVLSEQLLLLAKTLYRMPIGDITILSAWLSAATIALGVYFMVSGFSDIAGGVGKIFSLTLPKITYYPLHSPSVRDYLYRFNLPVEAALGKILFGEYNRDKDATNSCILSMILPFVIGFWLFPSPNILFWACYMSLLVGLDFLLFRRIKTRLTAPFRLLTLVLTLPSYLIIPDGAIQYKANVLFAMFGFGQTALFNDAIIYIIMTNAFLLILSAMMASSIFNTLSRITRQQFPTLWWGLSFVASTAILVITTSFLLWNAR